MDPFNYQVNHNYVVILIFVKLKLVYLAHAYVKQLIGKFINIIIIMYKSCFFFNHV